MFAKFVLYADKYEDAKYKSSQVYTLILGLWCLHLSFPYNNGTTVALPFSIADWLELAEYIYRSSWVYCT
jgi:hypothetical protein